MTTVSSPNPRLDSDERDVADFLARLGKNWGLFLAFGIVSVLIGAAMMIWPNATVGVVAILLGAWLIVSGVFALVSSFASDGSDTTARVLMGIVGALSVLLGVLAFSSLADAVNILALFVGIGWFMRGVIELVLGIQAKGQQGRGLTIFLGVLGVVAGLIVLVWPGITLLALAWISGVWLVILGLIWIFGSFKIKKDGAEALKALQSGSPAA